jgi:hypothetical protein
VGSAEPPAADLSGSYSGVLRLEGDDIESDFTIEQEDGRIHASLSTDVGLTAEGSGRLEGTVLRVRLGYDSSCAGTLELAGQAIDGGARLAGTVEAEDCTGAVTGSFSLARR